MSLKAFGKLHRNHQEPPGTVLNGTKSTGENRPWWFIAAFLIVRTYRELGAGAAEESAAALQKRSAGSAQMI